MSVLIPYLIGIGSLYGFIAALFFVVVLYCAAMNLKYQDGSPAGIVPRVFLTLIGAILAAVWPIVLWQEYTAEPK